MTELPLLPNLRELDLVQPLITSLHGIQRFGTLTRVAVAYAPKLRSIMGVDQLPLLNELDFDKCIHGEWLPIVAKLKSLRFLRLNECGSLPSIKFLEDMPKLEDFAFVDTNVIDGDLSPLLGLNWAGFFSKKHCSHTPKQIIALLEAKAAGKTAQ